MDSYKSKVSIFWDDVTKPEIKDLSQYKIYDFDSGTTSQAVIFLLHKNRLALVKTLDFYPRAVMSLLADDELLLPRFLEIMGKPRESIPQYVWDRTTPETREILRKWAGNEEWIIPSDQEEEEEEEDE